MNTTPKATTDAGSSSSGEPGVRAKDHASMAVVLAGAAVAWFGWGHQGGIGLWWLRAGMLASALALVAGIRIVRCITAPPTLATDPRARRVYWTAVAAEVALIVLGAVVLGLTGRGAYLSSWTLFVVGAHFLAFVGPFNAPILRRAALACTLVAAAAVASGLLGWAPAATVAGAGGGITLLAFAVVLLIAEGRRLGDGRAGR